MKNLKRFAQLIAIAILFPLFAACTQIDTGNVGIESTLGQIKKEELQPGMHFTLFKRVTEITGKQVPIHMEDLKPQTSDKITLADMDVDIFVQTNTAKAADIMIKYSGDITHVDKEDGDRAGFNFVYRIAREQIYDVASKHGSQTIHLERAALAGEIQKALQAKLDHAAGGEQWWTITDVNVRNLQTDPALEANIKAAAQAQFAAQAKENEIMVARKEAERKRIEAQGEADAIRLKAEAIRANGGEDYVKLQAIAKWDGKLPVTNATGAVPFIGLK